MKLKQFLGRKGIEPSITNKLLDLQSNPSNQQTEPSFYKKFCSLNPSIDLFFNIVIPDRQK